MAVPNTDTFSLADVLTEIFGGAYENYGLQDCFSNAQAGGFDPNYSGSKNSLYNFRNYTHLYWSVTTDYVIYFDAWGNACTINYWSISSNQPWYLTQDQSEITAGYASPTSYNGSVNVYFSCNEYNYDFFDHMASINFYNLNTSNFLGSVTAFMWGQSGTCY